MVNSLTTDTTENPSCENSITGEPEKATVHRFKRGRIRINTRAIAELESCVQGMKIAMDEMKEAQSRREKLREAFRRSMNRIKVPPEDKINEFWGKFYDQFYGKPDEILTADDKERLDKSQKYLKTNEDDYRTALEDLQRQRELVYYRHGFADGIKYAEDYMNLGKAQPQTEG